MFHRGWFLVDCAELRQRELAQGVLQTYGVAKAVGQAAELRVALADPDRFAGVVLQASTASLATRVRTIRAVAPLVPVLVLVDDPSAPLLTWLHGQGVECVGACASAATLTGFAQRALAFGFLPDQRLSRTVQQMAERLALTPREVQLLVSTLGNESRGRMRRRFGISENTLKTQVRGLLRKCSERNLDRLAKNVLRVALLAERPPMTEQSLPAAPWAA